MFKGDKNVINKKEYYKALINKDMTNRDVAKMLGICETSLYNKVEGRSDFKHSEILKMIETFGSYTTNEIFFKL